MADQDMVEVIRPDGRRSSIPHSSVEMAIKKGYKVAPAPAAQNPEQPDSLSKAWTWLNSGRVTPNAALSFLTSGEQGKGTPQTVEALEQFSQSGPKLNDTDRKVNIPGFGEIDYNKFMSGVRAGEGRTLSSLTSPASIGTSVLGGASRLTNVAGKAARAILTGLGLAYGGSGVGSLASGLDKGITTPEGSQEALLGASQVLGAVPAAQELGRGTRGAASKLFPALKTGENAFIASLRPSSKDVPAIRSAFKKVAPELQASGVRDFEGLSNFAEKQRVNVAKETASEIARAGQSNFTIDPKAVGNSIRSRITELMKTRTSITGKMPIEARYIQSEADNIEHNLAQKPKTLGEAEQLVQDINQTLANFRKLDPQTQSRLIRMGDPVSVFTALKENLQGQIESQMAGYKDLKAKYAAYREIQNQADRRIDDIARTSGKTDIMQRHAAEGIGSALGALFSGQYLHGIADILAGRAGGDIYLESASRPERVLRRGLSTQKPINFGLQAVQPVAEGAKNQQ